MIAGSLTSGVLAIVAVLVGWGIYDRLTRPAGEQGTVGWDPVSISQQMGLSPRTAVWATLSVPVLIFLFGFGAGFWILSRRSRA